MINLLQPRSEPALSLYLALQSEAAHRKGREIEQWNRAELQPVHAAALAVFPQYGLRPPTRRKVESAQVYACGSIDCGAKWAYALIDTVRRDLE